ncbi:putative hemolysin III [Oceanicola granulosus HTCC2516]|uniref:Putative hemolysin III n=1 Tax=Oceanicola granulosus (strain ATCC BAA-861 / DSM 15982 / KCTC 12143 / HTCC2516) TaxID=314256 RepID=Q2CFJ3_OCEGH|nr:hemolysin III family protein [Oceanicola granulosus]EAR51489.1 putative hemolysin III [Oceanicola granulosus HTCC2516]
MSDAPDTYPTFTRAERVADGLMHLVGVGFAITGAVLLVVLAAGAKPWVITAAAIVYALALIATFVASGLYHMTPWEGARPTLRRIDHAAIYIKIAGTYTPLVAMIGSAFGWVLLGVVWALAMVGAVAKLFFWRRPGHMGTLLYLVLAWLSVALMWPLAERMPPGGMALILAGGLLYTVGTIFYSRKSLRFQNAIWHGFVLAASACFFAAITWGVAVVG